MIVFAINDKFCNLVMIQLAICVAYIYRQKTTKSSQTKTTTELTCFTTCWTFVSRASSSPRLWKFLLVQPHHPSGCRHSFPQARTLHCRIWHAFSEAAGVCWSSWFDRRGSSLLSISGLDYSLQNSSTPFHFLVYLILVQWREVRCHVCEDELRGETLFCSRML